MERNQTPIEHGLPDRQSGSVDNDLLRHAIAGVHDDRGPQVAGRARPVRTKGDDHEDRDRIRLLEIQNRLVAVGVTQTWKLC